MLVFLVSLFLSIIFIFGIYIILREKLNCWKVVFVGTGDNLVVAKSKYNYLRQNNVNCRLRQNRANMGMIETTNPTMQVVLEVNKKDISKAKGLLR